MPPPTKYALRLLLKRPPERVAIVGTDVGCILATLERCVRTLKNGLPQTRPQREAVSAVIFLISPRYSCSEQRRAPPQHREAM